MSMFGMKILQARNQSVYSPNFSITRNTTSQYQSEGGLGLAGEIPGRARCSVDFATRRTTPMWTFNSSTSSRRQLKTFWDAMRPKEKAQRQEEEEQLRDRKEEEEAETYHFPANATHFFSESCPCGGIQDRMECRTGTAVPRKFDSICVMQKA